MTKLIKAAGEEAYKIVTVAKDAARGLREAGEAIGALADVEGGNAPETFRETAITIVIGAKQE